MAYTCACYPDQDATLEEAQAYKFDLVARKLGLHAGMRLLDVGCGWGGMAMHAAREYGVQALGVTLSAEQAAWAQEAIEKEGLSGLAEVRHMDYRDVPETGFDAGQLDRADRAHRQGESAGLLLFPVPEAEGRRAAAEPLHHPAGQHRARHPQARVHQPVRLPRRRARGARLPDLAHDDPGFEVRHEENLREHYARTLAAWCANLDAHWSEAVREVGQGTARVWRLYMAGSRLGFDRNHIELHQVLSVRLAVDGTSGMPLRPDWEQPRVLAS